MILAFDLGLLPGVLLSDSLCAPPSPPVLAATSGSPRSMLRRGDPCKSAASSSCPVTRARSASPFVTLPPISPLPSSVPRLAGRTRALPAALRHVPVRVGDSDIMSFVFVVIVFVVASCPAPSQPDRAVRQHIPDVTVDYALGQRHFLPQWRNPQLKLLSTARRGLNRPPLFG